MKNRLGIIVSNLLLITTIAAAQHVSVAYNVIDRVGISVSGNQISRTAGGTGWGTSGGALDVIIEEGDYIVFDAGLRFVIGFSDVNVDAHYNTIDYACQTYTEYRFYTYSNGSGQNTGDTWSAGDKIKIEFKSGEVNFYIESSLVYTFTTSITQFIVDFSILSGSINNLEVFKLPDGGNNASVTYDVIDRVGISVSGNQISRTAGGTGWGTSGGALDVIIEDGDYILFDAGLRFVIGFSDVNVDAHYNTIDYACQTYTEYRFYTYSNGSGQNTGDTWSAGDKIKIEFKSGEVNFYIESSLVYTFTTSITQFIVDFSILSGSINNLEVFKLNDGGGGAPTCSDGIQNQGELGIDCDGPCPACPPGGSGLWTANGASIYYTSGNVGIGITNPPAKLTVNGAGLFTQVKVKTDVSTFPDFVFEPDYPLMTITEVDNYIRTHGHLPDIPTAQEAVSDGHDIGAMNLKLLQKIEELTLYIIDQEKTNDEMRKAYGDLTISNADRDQRINNLLPLKQENAHLQTTIESLCNRLSLLEEQINELSAMSCQPSAKKNSQLKAHN